jgi:hydroxylaminobenzene mutase
MTAPSRAFSIRQERLMQLGALLFLLGLVSGLFTGAMANPRMGLSAHMEGVINGIFLIALGAIWGRVHLGRIAEGVAFWAFVFGTATNWLVTLLAALWGTGRMTPIAAPGLEGAEWQETIVNAGLTALTLAMLTAGALLVIGLLRRA